MRSHSLKFQDPRAKKDNMMNKTATTYDQFVASLDSDERKKFDEGYHEHLLSELILALMEEDDITVRRLAQATKISPTIIQGLRSAKRKNITLQTLIKIIDVFGYSLILERPAKRGLLKNRIVLHSHSVEKPIYKTK